MALAFFSFLLGVACAYPKSRVADEQKTVIVYRLLWLDTLVSYISWCTGGTVAVSDPPGIPS